jgi:hypothetical protein
MEVVLNLRLVADQRLHRVIDDMRIGRHPAKYSERDRHYWRIKTIEEFGPSKELLDEAWAEHRALKTDAPAVEYQRVEVASALAVGG